MDHGAETGLHIALKAETIFTIGGFPVTNTLLMTWVVMLVLGIIAILVGMSIKKIPSKVQTFFELLFGGILDYMETVLENRSLAIKFFPLIATLFLFILFGNWLGLVPGFEAITATTEATHGEPAYLFHPINTDLNTTLALAIIAFMVIEITGVAMLSLSGLMIKNAIVLVDQMDIEIGEGKARFDAVVDSAASRVRPVMMGALTTVLGVIPLFSDAFFKSMAVVLVFGLSFATLLTLVVVPALYTALFKIDSTESEVG